jgi:hypothetical protein
MHAAVNFSPNTSAKNNCEAHLVGASFHLLLQISLDNNALLRMCISHQPKSKFRLADRFLMPEHEKTTQLPLQKETLEEDDIAALRAQSRLRKRLAERRTSRLPQPP